MFLLQVVCMGRYDRSTWGRILHQCLRRHYHLLQRESFKLVELLFVSCLHTVVLSQPLPLLAALWAGMPSHQHITAADAELMLLLSCYSSPYADA
jgi:hypothetical protein